MKLIYLLVFLSFSLVQFSCVRQNFGKPTNTNGNDPGFAYYKTIAELRSSMGVAGSKEIKDNIIISGIVIADDRNGNFYKQIIIDDGTAAMPILLDAYNLYNDFPVGRKIYVKCKGLYTNFYYKLPQLGFCPDNRDAVVPIPFHLWSQYLIKGDFGHEAKSISVSIADAMKSKPELFNRLITLTDAQVLDTISTTQYALPANLAAATNIKLMDCDSNSITLRTSGYSSFQAYKPPLGRGTLTAIYTVYNNTPQLVLRDTADAQMKSIRCY